LQARGAVDVGDGREVGATLFDDVAHRRHEGRHVVLCVVEPVRSLVGEDGGREGSERLAALDRAVDAVAGGGVAREARIDRRPSARGPHSNRPRAQATTLPSATSAATREAASSIGSA